MRKLIYKTPSYSTLSHADKIFQKNTVRICLQNDNAELKVLLNYKWQWETERVWNAEISNKKIAKKWE